MKLTVAAISFGGAVNAHTGEVLNSGPLWGPHSRPFDMRARLMATSPDMNWIVVNDITSALLAHAREMAAEDLRRLTLVTVSTGAGARTYDFRTNTVPINDQGLQGEFGHIPIDFFFRGRLVEQRCDCGEQNHLNAFCSGRGIVRLAEELARRELDPEAQSLVQAMHAKPDDTKIDALAFAVENVSPFATELLHSVTRPVARAMVDLLTFDAEVDRIMFTGGVVDVMGERYLQSLKEHLAAQRMYQISDRDPSFLHRRLRLAAPGNYAGLRGAAIAASESLRALSQGSYFGRVRRNKSSVKIASWTLQATKTASSQLVRCHAFLTSEGCEPVSDVLGAGAGGSRRLVIVDATVDRLYGDLIQEFFQRHRVAALVVPMRVNEGAKSLPTVQRLLDEMEAYGVTRRDEPVIGIGGGVLLDVLGLAASMYRRGIPYIRVPTTLLALVDAGVGAKVGANFRGHKNRVGAFHLPTHTILDTTFLKTLPQRQLRSGMAEIIKMALINDDDLFTRLERDGLTALQSRFQDFDKADAIVETAIEGMLLQLASNLWEDDLERPVDLGHTFGPILEMEADVKLLHGEAVALDLAVSAALSCHRSLMKMSDFVRVLRLLRTLRLPTSHSSCERHLLSRALLEASRHRGGHQRVPLLNGIGSTVFVNDITSSELEASLQLIASVK